MLKALRSKLFDLAGAKEVMAVLGFKKVSAADPVDTAVVLPWDEGEELIASTATNVPVAPMATATVATATTRNEGVAPPSGAQLESTSAVALADAWSWLEQQIESALESEGSKRPKATTCAEVVLQVSAFWSTTFFSVFST
jgi:hypothetical protein